METVALYSSHFLFGYRPFAPKKIPVYLVVFYIIIFNICFYQNTKSAAKVRTVSYYPDITDDLSPIS